MILFDNIGFMLEAAEAERIDTVLTYDVTLFAVYFAKACQLFRIHYNIIRKPMRLSQRFNAPAAF